MGDIDEKLADENEKFVAIKSAFETHDDKDGNNKFKLTSKAALMQVNKIEKSDNFELFCDIVTLCRSEDLPLLFEDERFVVIRKHEFVNRDEV